VLPLPGDPDRLGRNPGDRPALPIEAFHADPAARRAVETVYAADFELFEYPSGDVPDR
jgi:hypothetical protein